jgi:predicted peroxiredoxin
MENYLTDSDYEIIVVEQEDGHPFNRGKLLNIGFEKGVEYGCDYFVFHDVDMLPENVDYSYPDKPLHLATHLQEHDYETTFFDYFGGVTMFTKEDFESINGYSNEYWGWGFEDDDLLVRCLQRGLPIDTDETGIGDIQDIETFKFDGNSSMVLSSNKDLFEDEFTISVMVKPQDIHINENSDYDEFPIISIPGYNIGLFYNSFRRFFCQVYDTDKKDYSISTDIIGERWIHLTMTYENDSVIKFYTDGELVGETAMNNPILGLDTDNIFVGLGNGNKTNSDVFYGNISNIEIWDVSLTQEEIKEIYTQPKRPKLRNFGEYKSSEFLVSQIVPELSYENTCVDLGGTYKIQTDNIYIEKLHQSFKTFQPKPYRRESRFLSLKHKSNSSIGNRWVHEETRKNQLRYYNEVRTDLIDFNIDGLNTLRYETLGQEKLSDKMTKIKVEL